jgi:NAD(P)-dependent dehydrogenase (short-subunit alcohol dehydrogenase family)
LAIGAGSGIGRSIAIEFAREGAKIAINDVGYGSAKTVLEEVKALGGAGLPLRADVVVHREINDIVERIT